MVERRQRTQGVVPRRRKAPSENALSVTDDLPLRPRLSASELNVVDSYLGGPLAEIFFEEGRPETGE